MIKTVLIVDDDVDFVAAVSCYLERQGYRVLSAGDGQSGLRLARLERPELILMDVMMNERTEGLFAIQEIRRDPELARVPVFVLTSLYSKTDFHVEPERGWMAHDEFFTKPVDVQQLLERIRQRIGSPDEALARTEDAP
jgi:CheY-like chemotaxis protein